MVQNRTAIFADHFIFDHGTDATYQQQWDALYLLQRTVPAGNAFPLNKMNIQYDNKSTIQTCGLLMG
jgi:hypothetical protein